MTNTTVEPMQSSPYQHEEDKELSQPPEPLSTTPIPSSTAAQQRSSRLPPPSASRLLRPDDATHALFLLQQEHKILLEDFQNLDEHWRNECQVLKNELQQQQQGYLESMEEVVRQRDEQSVKYQEDMAALQHDYEQNVELLQDMEVTVQTLKTEHDQIVHELELEKQARQNDSQQASAAKNAQHDQLAADYEALQKEKAEWEAEISKLQQSTEQLLDGKDEQVSASKEKNATVTACC